MTATLPNLVRQAAVFSVALFAFALISFDQAAIPVISSPTVLLGVLMIAVTALAVIVSGGLRPLSPILLFLFAFLLWSIATVTWSVSPEHTLVRARTDVQIAVMMWAVYEALPRESSQILVMRALGLGVIPVAAQTIWNFIHKMDVASVVFDASSVEAFQTRYSAYGYNPNELGCTLAITIPFSVYLATRSKGILALLCWVQVGMAVLATMVTGSRGGMITAAVALLYVPVAFFQLPRLHRVICTVVLVGLTSYIIAKPPSGARERFLSIRSELKHGTMTGRTTLWKNSFRVFEEHPFEGVGAAAVEKAMIRFSGRSDLISHNTFLSILSETGVIGFTLFGLSALAILICVLEMPFDDRLLWLAVLATMAVGLVSITFEQRKHIWFVAALAAAQAGRLRTYEFRRAKSSAALTGESGALPAVV